MREAMRLASELWRDARAYAPARPARGLLTAWLAAIAVWIAISLLAWRAERSLGNASLVTGYALMAAMLFLGSFGLRKRVLVLPLGTARAWMRAHLVVSAICVPLYFQHAGGLWPGGFYEQALALAFYAVALTGLAGYALERLLPKRLTDLDSEIIYERIPHEIAELRERAEAVVVQAMQQLGSDTLGRYYHESLDWYFWKPRFLVSHLVGGRRAARWIGGHISALARYLSEEERAYLDRIEALAARKSHLDAHLVMQGALKYWLFLHIPLAVALVLLVLWHLLLVNIYAV